MTPRRRRRTVTVGLALLGGVLLSRKWFTVIDVTGRSMEPTLSPSARVLLLRARSVRLGDVVVVRVNDLTMVKRVTAFTSDGLLFLEGDNASSSWDSRQFGPVARSQIVGRVVWPRLTPVRAR